MIKPMVNKESVNLQNDLKRLCQLWVMKNKPELYAALQAELGIKVKSMDSRLVAILENAQKRIA